MKPPETNAIIIRNVLGYERGRSFPLVVHSVQGRWLEAATAAAFIDMAKAASTNGVRLQITDGFRSMEEQQNLWEERQDPDKREHLGVAARPGWSTHQCGRSIDIKTGITVPMLASGCTSVVFEWLRAHASEFGFVRNVPSEAWHWTHAGAEEIRRP